MDNDANGLGNENTLVEARRSAWLANRSGSLARNQERLQKMSDDDEVENLLSMVKDVFANLSSIDTIVHRHT